jgi:transposase InsO family protein
VCDEHGIEHRLTKVNHPWTNGQVERMNRTLKDATVKRYHYDSHDQLRAHLQPLRGRLQPRPPAQDAARPHALRVRLPDLDEEPERFRLDPSHHIPGPYT